MLIPFDKIGLDENITLGPCLGKKELQELRGQSPEPFGTVNISIYTDGYTKIL